jgi:hypothetical protein
VPLLTHVLHTESLATETQSFVREVLRMVGHANGAQKPLPKAELMALSTTASISACEQKVLRLVSAAFTRPTWSSPCRQSAPCASLFGHIEPQETHHGQSSPENKGVARSHFSQAVAQRRRN